MIQRCRMLLALSTAERRLLLEAGATLILAWGGLQVLPVNTVLRLAGRYVRAAARQQSLADDAMKVGRAVTACARLAPIVMTCLVRAIAADAMVRRRGLSTTLHVGVRPRAGRSAPLHAHAWLECDGAIVVGAVEDLGSYAACVLPRPA